MEYLEASIIRLLWNVPIPFTLSNKQIHKPTDIYFAKQTNQPTNKHPYKQTNQQTQRWQQSDVCNVRMYPLAVFVLFRVVGPIDKEVRFMLRCFWPFQELAKCHDTIHGESGTQLKMIWISCQIVWNCKNRFIQVMPTHIFLLSRSVLKAFLMNHGRLISVLGKK